MTVQHSRPLSERWSGVAAFDATRLEVTDDAVQVGSSPTDRLELGVSAGRRMDGSLTLGAGARALTVTDAAPTTPDVGNGSRPLFWDPRWFVSLGPFVALDHELGRGWSLVGRLEPGVTLLHERRPEGADPELLLQASFDAGVRHVSGRWSTLFQLFHQQGRFDGYRAYGARLTVTGLTSPGGQR